MRQALAAVVILAGMARISAAQDTALAVETSPSPATRGSLAWLLVRPPGPVDTATSLDGVAAGEPLHFERREDGRFRTLVGLPLEGGDSLSIELLYSRGATAERARVMLPLRQASYPSERLRVAPAYAEPDSAARVRMEAEFVQSRAVSRAAHDTPRLWSGPFRPPRDSRITSAFGTAREFNGTVTSRHLGTDYAGAVGAPVRAPARAIVALVADFYLAGTQSTWTTAAGSSPGTST